MHSFPENRLPQDKLDQQIRQCAKKPLCISIPYGDQPGMTMHDTSAAIADTLKPGTITTPSATQGIKDIFTEITSIAGKAMKGVCTKLEWFETREHLRSEEAHLRLHGCIDWEVDKLTARTLRKFHDLMERWEKEPFPAFAEAA